MSKKLSLDRIDHKILAILQQDGRISFQRLSEQVNLTARPCLERVRRLEKAGVIQGYRAIIQQQEPEPSMVIVAQVTLADHSTSQAAFIKAINHTPMVLDAWLMTGNFDFQLRIGCQSLEQYHQLSSQWLQHPEFKIERIITSVELQQIKRTTLPPKPPT